MKYFIIAGEASGDLHASHLIASVRAKDSAACFVGLGGDKMRAAGCSIRVDYRDMAYMGVVAVLRNIRHIRRNFRIAYASLSEERPDVLILVDYPSFNLRVAAYCRKHLPQTRVVYYIPPKVWAWKSWRVHKIARYSDKILGIFPFEPVFYARYGYTCEYVGNPTADCIREWRKTREDQADVSTTGDDRPVIALLPGSRKSEVSHCLPVMLEAARRVAGDKYRIVVAAAPGLEDSCYTRYLAGEALTRDTYGLVHTARAAVVNSGTATLETALLECPQTAVYYIACSRWLEGLIRPIVFRTPHFTLVNILARRTVIQELIAKRFSTEEVERELVRLVSDTDYRTTMLEGYADISRKLSTCPASDTAARAIVSLGIS